MKRALIFVFIWLMITACEDQGTSVPTITSINHSPPVTYFPQTINTPPAYLEARVTGELILENGCLRVKDFDGKSVLLIWRPGFSTKTVEGNVQIIDSKNQVTASVGDFVEVGGGFDAHPELYGLTEPIPENCLGSFWLVGESIKKIDKP